MVPSSNSEAADLIIKEMDWPGVNFLVDEAQKYWQEEPTMTQYTTGATRNDSGGKPDYEGFLSPLVIERFGEYMNTHRKTADGGYRASDNWQLGIPKEAYMKSLWRHFLTVWKRHRGFPVVPVNARDPQNIEEDLCAMLFNTQGMLHEILKEREEIK